MTLVFSASISRFACRAALLALAMAIAGCEPLVMTKVRPAKAREVSGLIVTVTEPWTRLADALPQARDGTQVWTQDGYVLDHLVIFSPVPVGGALFAGGNGGPAFPTYRPDMTPEDLAGWLTESLRLLHARGNNAVVDSTRVSAAPNAEAAATQVDLRMQNPEGAPMRGFAVLIPRSRAVHVILFMAAEPYYADLRRPMAERVAHSARVDSGR